MRLERILRVEENIFAEIETVIKKNNQLERCKERSGCCLLDGHEGKHLYKCDGRFCPGLSWSMTNMAHPSSCYVDMIIKDADRSQKKKFKL